MAKLNKHCTYLRKDNAGKNGNAGTSLKCPAGSWLTGGGLIAHTLKSGQYNGSKPIGNNTYQCMHYGKGTFECYAICCK